MHTPTLFDSVFLGGFECSSHRRGDGRRLDLLRSTGHDAHAASDYRAMRRHGIHSVRDGLRWHLIEPTPGRYDWSSFLPMLHAARDIGVQPIWDLCHYGWPDGIDIWRPQFVDRFARFAAAAAALVRDETDAMPFYCPVNEIAFWSWAGGDVARFNPCEHGRGFELKHQLVRAAIAGIEAVRAVDPRARFVHVDPIIHTAAHPHRPDDRTEAEAFRRAQFQSWDMIRGDLWPGLGGRPELLDIVGVNFYPDNQWHIGGGTIPRGHPQFRPFREMLAEIHQRYGRPVLIAETGSEGQERAPWLAYVGEETRAAMAEGVPLEGLCLYPVLDYPGWDNDRHCPVGLLGFPDAQGSRPAEGRLAAELRRQQAIFDDMTLPNQETLGEAAE